MNFIDITGQRFGKLSVIERVANNKYNQIQWSCKCDCGKKIIVQGCNLRNGRTKSCGCLKKEKYFKHGHSRRHKISKTYSVWRGMIQRCYNPNKNYYEDYGGRGITVCDRWLPENNGFINFLKDMGECPPGMSLDRIENNKLKDGYSPNNCKWSTPEQQNRNMRSNILIPFNGKSICLKDYCKIKNLNYDTVSGRLFRGLSLEDALTIPVQKINRKSLLIHNYEHKFSYALRRLKSNKINSSKYLPYNSKQLCDHLESIRLNQNNFCPMCHTAYDIKPFDIDHIIPTHTAKTKEELLHLFNLNNLSLLCYKCNRYVKRGRLDIKYNYGF